jgi:nitrogen fixation NifU-like protein
VVDEDGGAPSDAVRARLRDPVGAGSFPPETPGVVSGEAGSIDGGRLVRIQLAVAAGGTIADVRFKAFGCPATIACASLLSERLPGRSLARAGEIDAAELAASLRLPPSRLAAAETVASALRAALARARAET